MGTRRKKAPKKCPTCKIMKSGSGSDRKVRVSQKMQNVYGKRARDYNSDDDDEEDEEVDESDEDIGGERDGLSDVSDNEAGPTEDSDEERDVHTGITRFAEGCKVFRVAFLSIIKKNVDKLVLVLSAHKKLIVAKLAEQVAEWS